MVHVYFPVSPEFAVANNGYTKGRNVLNIIQNGSGVNVVSVNALNEFPELFEGRSRVSILFLTEGDFPEPTVPPPGV